MKEKKKKEKKEKKKKKKKDKGDDLEMEFDKALAKSGLLKKEPTQTNGGGGNTSKQVINHLLCSVIFLLCLLFHLNE